MAKKKQPKKPIDEATEVALHSIHSAVAYGNRVLVDFESKLDADPFAAFDGSDGLFRQVARLTVAKRIAKLLDKRPVEAVRNSARDEAMRMAQFPYRSTSVTANLMHQEVAAAWAAFGKDGAL